GTHGYMAPEVLSKGVTYDSSADWFSFGCVLYKLVKGHSPFRQHTMKDKHEIDLMTLTKVCSDCILHGYIKKLGGSFASVWQTRYAKLYPNRLELHPESTVKPELIFLQQIEEVSADLQHIKGEQCIVVRTKDGKIVLTYHDEISLKEWAVSLRSAHKCSMEMLGNIAKKAGKIYGTDRDAMIPALQRSTNGN
ncbi:G protein-coupled receptor kinase 1, partial [Dufourea novaeangliae]